MGLTQRDYVAVDDTGSRVIVVVSWIFPALATLAVFGRFSARRLKKSEIGWDDWLILLCLVRNSILYIKSRSPICHLGASMGSYCDHLVM